jgi:serine/threonine protein kinase
MTVPDRLRGVDGGRMSSLADYEIVELLCEGNNGHFYLARPPARLRLEVEFVVLKVFVGRVAEHAYERGVRELRAFAGVRSPYLVRIFDAVLDDRFAYAMEYLPLGSLAAPARELERAGVLTVLEHAARAAHDLHEAGIAHGDIKPGNILLADGSEGQVAGRLSDLGLARLLAPGNTLTGMGGANSVEYTDPELLAGARPSRRTEVWSLGATIHRALTGVGFYGELPDHQPLLAIRSVLSRRPRLHDGLEPDAARLIGDCIAHGNARIDTAGEAAVRLAGIKR